MSAALPPPDNAALARQAFERGEAEAAAGSHEEARRWFDRARRLAPRDPMPRLMLATGLLGHDDRVAATLLAELTATHDVREVWLGLAAALHRLGDHSGAMRALDAALRRHVVDPAIASIADAITTAAGAAGWRGITRDGRSIGTEYRSGARLIGEPIDHAAIAATLGCVSCRDGGLAGWAWHQGDPDTDPVITIRSGKGRQNLVITATDTATNITGDGLLARPRSFIVSAAMLSGMRGPLHVVGRDGRDLLGSPLNPAAEATASAAAAETLARLYPAGPSRKRPMPAPPLAMPVAVNVQPMLRKPLRRLLADVVVPVHDGIAQTLACLDSVLTTLPRQSRLIVIDDASRDPDLVEALDSLARSQRIQLIRNKRNIGFPASANIGLNVTRGRDVVLLNSDTLVASGWLEDLRTVAYSASDIGTVTPLSNDATILSYPESTGGNPVPDRPATDWLSTMARRANRTMAVEIPVGVGFCLYMRRACLDQVGLLRADVFAQGYGEENDFCLRARHLGWRHAAAPGVFVAHVGGQSFGAAAQHLQARNSTLLERMHPGYGQLIAAFAMQDPLAAARRRLDLARWRALRKRGGQAAIIITHAAGGGVERQVAAAARRHSARGHRAVVLRPSRTPSGAACVTVSDGTSNGFPNLRYAMPDELPQLRRLLAGEKPREIELHHTVGHHPAVLQLLPRLDIPYDVHVHDYAWLCGRVALVGPTQRYCGEPDVARCEACVADTGSLIDEDISVSALRRRSALLFARARRILVPSADTAARISRHFPSINAQVQPHEDDATVPEPLPVAPSKCCRVCVIGAIGVQKGFQVLLDCARDAAERALPLEFVVVGHSIDDRRLLATGRVFVTGEFAPEEATALIRAQNATIALLPSIWPETWCFALGDAWRAGLRVVAFDIGAQAERIRQTGRGLVLPLGLQPQAVNNALISAVGLSANGRV